MFRRNPALSAWPFVVVILVQTAVGGFSVYALSASRAYVTGESLWSKGQHAAEYFLDRYLEISDPTDLARFRKAIAVPLSYRRGRLCLDASPPDDVCAYRAFVEAGNPKEDLPSLIWTFHAFRNAPYASTAFRRWIETDPYILELARLGDRAGSASAVEMPALRQRLQEIDTAITPRTIAFSLALNEGARVVETLLMVLNIAFAGLLAGLTIWRVSRFVSARRQIEGRLSWQASHDDLTGLLNRRAFEDNLARTTKLPKDGPAPSRTLMMIDLDQFKIVNDTCGHAAGDALLRRICQPLQKMLGADDTLARLGGDEFGILMPDAELAQAQTVAERIRATVEKVHFVWGGQTFRVTASIGLVHDEGQLFTTDEMMRAADMACFMAKEKGRNRIHLHREADQELLGRVREMTWVQRIHHALDGNAFCLYAQEIVPLAARADEGLKLEVLVRLRDETGLLIPPASFLPAAERFGLMGLIDRRVVRTAFQILAQRQAIADLPTIGSCWINLSGPTISDETFRDFLKTAFEEYRIRPETICFELTETSAIVDLDGARGFIKDLRALGCMFALDDFGTGMSSFSYLKELPVDILKIDGGFVRNMLEDRTERAMVEMITYVGHVMGKQIVAESVETDALAAALREIGVDFGQGYGIAKPLPFHSRFESALPAPRPLTPAYRRLSA